MIRVYLIIISLLLACTDFAYSQKSTKKLKPKWITETPHPKNPTYRFHVTYVDNAESISGARMLSKSELYRLVEKSESIKVIEDYENESHQVSANNYLSEKTDEVYNMKILSDGDEVNLNYMKLDEYWVESFRGGVRYLEFYTLYAVARPGMVPQFDDVYFTDKYGISAMARSLIPGWGQLYKGQKVKGACFMGGEIVLIGGIIVSENLRSSYVKKMREQPKFFQTYNTKADNWENIRNVCIGAAAALYVYNLIDAIVSPGAKRTIVKKQEFPLIQPVACRDFNGVSFSWNF